MRTARVKVFPYDESWKLAFEEIRREIENVLGDLIIGIEHVGSTSVEGLSAKPCIDLDVVIKDYGVSASTMYKEITFIFSGTNTRIAVFCVLPSFFSFALRFFSLRAFVTASRIIL